MKRRLIVFCLMFMITVVLSLSVFAEEISVTTKVPDSHNVFVRVIGDGFVEADSVPIKNGRLTVSRQKCQEYFVVPENGYKFEKLFYNGKDVSAMVRESRFIAAPLTADSRMTVFFTKTSDNDIEAERIRTDEGFFITGESDRSVVFIIIFLVSLAAIAACLIIRGKKIKK